MNERLQTLLDHVNLAHRETWEVLAHVKPEDQDRHVYSTEGVEWKVRDVLAHMADAERGLPGQIRRLLVGKPTIPDDFDLNRWNRGAVRKRASQTYSEILADLDRAHLETVSALAAVDVADLDRVGRHPSGKMLTAEGYFRRMADHRREHTADISKAIHPSDTGAG